MEIEIRTYENFDRQACLDAFESNVPQYFTQSEIADFTYFLDHFQIKGSAGIKAEKTYFYVLELDGKVIGAGGFGDKENDNHITLAWGFVHQQYHKKGHGLLLLQFRLAEIKRIYQNPTVYLDTTQHSYSFFEKFGFTTTKITPDFYEQGMHRYDIEWVDSM